MFKVLFAMNLGITGGIASGKSTVTRIFHDLGAITISADEIARRITAPGTPLAAEVLRVFGSQYAQIDDNQAIDRAHLAKDIFPNAALRKKLEAITHPAILAEINRLMKSSIESNKKALIAVEVPLLYEAGLTHMFDSVLVVSCPMSTQLARLKLRSPEQNEQDLIARINSQMPLSEKLTKADFVISSEVPLDAMAADVAALYEKLSS